MSRNALRWLGAFIAASIVIVIGAVAIVYVAGDRSGTQGTRQAGTAADGGSEAIQVAITAKACEPNDLTVPSGEASFAIINKSQRAVEWEILDGVMVVDERENIAPGFVQTLRTRLHPGKYAITCGLLSNPRGTLTVTAGADAAPAAPTLVDLIGPMAEYKIYVIGETRSLVGAAAEFADAVKAGDLDKAKSLYAPSRVSYERIEPVAELFSDLDASIDSRADDHEKAEESEDFTGFHRLEYLLFAKNTTEGAAPFAEKLKADTVDLEARIKGLTIPAKAMIGGAAVLIEEVAASKISGEEDRYSHTDLWDFQANIEGAQKIVELLRPLTERSDKTLSEKIDANFKTVNDILAKYRNADGSFQTY
ncbi:iron uptake system protein EfeO, partial [Mangrovicella endophytica]|uniref:iron uptake system protein EfeO n=1 Tax=Mangrovicella endophytica TaxID=2066697 RepID=UPI000C9DB207